MRLLLAIVSIAAIGVAAGCTEKPSTADCQKLMNHVVDMELEAGGASALGGDLAADVAEQKKKLIDYVRTDFIDTCEKNLPASQVKCGLKAKSMAQLADCDKTGT